MNGVARLALCSMILIASVIASVRASAQSADSESTVVVRGTRKSPTGSQRDATAASTVLSDEDLEAPGATSADVLARVPGVQLSRTGASSDLATASIRGATSAQTPVYLAGIRVNDDLTGAADLSELPLWMVDRVEVFRGNAPADADQLGVGGAVFFEPKWPRTTSVGAGAEAGSFGALAGFASGSVANRRSAALFSFRRAGADNDYRYALGTTAGSAEVTRRNADFSESDTWAVGRLRFAPGQRITTVMNAFDREQGAPGLGLLQTTRARAHVTRILAGLSARAPCAHDEDGVESCSLEATTSALVSRSRIDDPLRELSTIATRTDNDGQRIGQRVATRWSFGDRLGVGVAVDGAVARISVDQDSAPSIFARRLTLRPALMTSWETPLGIGVHAVGAVQCESIADHDASCDTLEPVGRIGVRAPIATGTVVRANAGRYVRVPTLGELFGISPLVRGSPDLRPERGINVDAGVTLTTTRSLEPWRAFVDAFVFERFVSDLVAYRRNLVENSIEPFNVGEARVRGFEFLGSVEGLALVKTELTVTLLDPRNTNPTVTNDILPFQSRFVTNGHVEIFTEPTESVVDRAALGLRIFHRSSRYADQAGLIVIAAQTTVDIEASLRLYEGRIATLLAVRDLFDAKQFDVVGLPLPGRSYHLGGELWWW